MRRSPEFLQRADLLKAMYMHVDLSHDTTRKCPRLPLQPATFCLVLCAHISGAPCPRMHTDLRFIRRCACCKSLLVGSRWQRALRQCAPWPCAGLSQEGGCRTAALLLWTFAAIWRHHSCIAIGVGVWAVSPAVHAWSPRHAETSFRPSSGCACRSMRKDTR